MGTRILSGDCRETMKTLEARSVHTCVTSPPYWGLRDYGIDGQIGKEPSPKEFVSTLVEVFEQVKRVLRDDGTLWLNLGDTYATGTTAGRQQSKNPGVGANNEEAQNSVGRVGTPAGMKTKDLIGIPWMVAFALRDAGWYLRQDIIWAKPNPMPESVTDRCTKSHEHIFLLSKSQKYYFDHEAIKEPSTMHQSDWNEDGTQKRDSKVRGDFAGKNTESGKEGFRAISETRNKRDVWTVPTLPYPGAHFATFPPALIKPCIQAGSPAGGIVLDPFGGAGTTGLVADRLGRDAILCELNPEYSKLADHRITDDAPLFTQVDQS